ncbi:MAG: lysozyme [Caulobacteraceae bacterium]|nr:lysozyme [Caulobacteraceae bacterium]
MRPRLTVSRSAVELIKAFEGYRAKAARLDDGRWTIGYGHTLTAREGAEVSERDAEALLLYDLIPVSHAVNELVFAPLNQNQFDALVSFVLNIGVRAFRSSLTYRRLNEGRLLEAALAMEMWRKSDLEGERIVIDALVRRRAAEKALFLRPAEGWTPAPTPVLPPKYDYDVVGIMPLQTPVATRTLLAGERAAAERAPEPSQEDEAPPSASEAAAAAVIERLEAILADSQPNLAEGRPAEAPAQASAEETPFDEPREPPIYARPPKRRRPNPMLLLGLGALGVGLFALGAIWGFAPAGSLVLGAPAASAGLAVAGAGVVCFSVAVYFLLERLGLPAERA